MSELTIKVEVAYATPHKQKIVALDVEKGLTIKECIERSHIHHIFPEIDIAQAKVGIFSRPAKLSDEVHDHDRIEIYRPLIADPKEMRKLRAQRAKAEGRADKITGGRAKSK
ncbi:RnfH family protein [Motilimonas eburnea]|uniref:RnfH family protein n=1 Tax=Motilimonas eburnea TaxID=1737488 RepID=UPI001E4A8FDF|nr:RnfH family protein [Motilimonas eburnea]